MRSTSSFFALVFIIAHAGALRAAEHDTWPSYMKANRFKCPGPIDTLKTPRTVTLGGKAYKHNGYRLEIEKPDADKKAKLGVVSAIKDTSIGTKKNFEAAVAWFKAEQVDWIVANGDLALEEFALEEVLDMLGATGVPTLLVLGNSESKGSFARAYAEREKKYPNLVNGTWVRQVVADDVELWTVPGYHDRKFVHQGAGCLYKAEDIEATVQGLSPAGEAPVVLVAHGPPLGKGKSAIDWMSDKTNVGDKQLNELIKTKSIAFGLFGHILEAGGAAVGKDFATPLKQNDKHAALYLNAGSLSGDPWRMNDGSTATGMAVLVTLEGGKASYVLKRLPGAPEE